MHPERRLRSNHHDAALWKFQPTVTNYSDFAGKSKKKKKSDFSNLVDLNEPKQSFKIPIAWAKQKLPVYWMWPRGHQYINSSLCLARKFFLENERWRPKVSPYSPTKTLMGQRPPEAAVHSHRGLRGRQAANGGVAKANSRQQTHCREAPSTSIKVTRYRLDHPVQLIAPSSAPLGSLILHSKPISNLNRSSPFLLGLSNFSRAPHGWWGRSDSSWPAVQKEPERSSG